METISELIKCFDSRLHHKPADADRKKYGNAINRNLQLKCVWHARLSLKLVEILSEFIDVASAIITITKHGTMLRIILCFCLLAVITEEPEFTEIIENVTVPAGNESIIDLFINRGRIISGISL